MTGGKRRKNGGEIKLAFIVQKNNKKNFIVWQTRSKQSNKLMNID